MKSMPTSSNKCTALERSRVATSCLLAGVLLAGGLWGCSDRSYAARAERHLGSVTQAAVETLRSVEEQRGVDEALGSYAHEIREAELFLAAQNSHEHQASYQRLSALVARHKEFLAALEAGQQDATALPTDDSGSGEEQHRLAKPEWVRTVNELLRETGEVRSLLRQGR